MRVGELHLPSPNSRNRGRPATAPRTRRRRLWTRGNRRVGALSPLAEQRPLLLLELCIGQDAPIVERGEFIELGGRGGRQPTARRGLLLFGVEALFGAVLL